VNVSQVFTADKRDLDQRLGHLGPERVREVVAGVRLVLEPRATGRSAAR
jgi:mRNA interferase MazF